MRSSVCASSAPAATATPFSSTERRRIATFSTRSADRRPLHRGLRLDQSAAASSTACAARRRPILPSVSAATTRSPFAARRARRREPGSQLRRERRLRQGDQDLQRRDGARRTLPRPRQRGRRHAGHARAAKRRRSRTSSRTTRHEQRQRSRRERARHGPAAGGASRHARQHHALQRAARHLRAKPIARARSTPTGSAATAPPGGAPDSASPCRTPPDSRPSCRPEGLAVVHNVDGGLVVTDQSTADLGGVTSPGWNAFAFNGPDAPPAPVNVRNSTSGVRHGGEQPVGALRPRSGCATLRP